MSSCQQPDCTNGVQDGNETGVDCGGDCAPCLTNNNNNSGGTTAASINGLWEYNASVNTANNIKTITVCEANNCKVDFTGNPVNSQSPQQGYWMYGMIGICNYPTQYSYTWDANMNLISGTHQVTSVSQDSLVLSQSSGANVFHYSKSAWTFADASSVEWEVTLDNSFPLNNELVIVIASGSMIAPEYDTIPIISGQTFYSGVKQANVTGMNPSLRLYVSDLTPYQGNEELVTITTKVRVSGTNIEAATDPTTYCNGPLTGGCSGYSNLYLATSYQVCTINYY